MVQSRGLTTAQSLPSVAGLDTSGCAGTDCLQRIVAVFGTTLALHPAAQAAMTRLQDQRSEFLCLTQPTLCSQAMQLLHTCCARRSWSRQAVRSCLSNTMLAACLHRSLVHAACLEHAPPELLHSQPAGMLPLRCRTVSGFPCPHGIRRQIQQLPLDTASRGDRPALRSLCWRRLVGAIPAQDAPLLEANMEYFPYVLLLFEVTSRSVCLARQARLGVAK